MADLQTNRVGSISTYAAEDNPDEHVDDHNEVHGRLQGGFAGVSFVIGTEAGDVINVGVQLEDVAGTAITFATTCWAYLSGDSGGVGVVGTAPTGGVAIGTDGEIIVEATADKVFLLESETDGDIDLDITDTGTPTFYLVVILPGGGKVVSGAITFA